MIDLRSDTVTKPTPKMREAMADAQVGDDVYEEDPTINRLESLAAQYVGKEAALFVPSGTMGNQIAILSHTRRGDEVIVEAQSHIFYYEVGGPAVLSGVQTRPVIGVRGVISPDDIRNSIRDENIHAPRTGLLCLENTHNRAGGAVISPDKMRAMVSCSHENGVPVHLDGARIFNAATYLKIEPCILTKDVDSVMFCLSKGLCAPIGSILAGTKGFISSARKYRKLLGGGMRQAGILAAAGIVALEEMVGRLDEDHKNALLLAESLAEIPGIRVKLKEVETNIILFSVIDLGVDAETFVTHLAGNGVLSGSFGEYIVRFVTHNDVTAELIEDAVTIIKRTAKSL